jgi:hypothetical protein
VRLVVGGAALACAVTLVAACSGSPGSSAGAASDPPASATPAGSGPPASPTQAASAPGASATPTGGTSSPPRGVAGAWSGFGCPDLEVTLGLSERDPTVAYQVIDFTNRGSATCFLEGYPGVSLAAGAPAVPLGLPARHNPSVPERAITLKPGAVANALLQITDARQLARAACDPVPAQDLIIYLPDGSSPVKVRYPTTACANRVQMMQVSVVSLGTGG